MNLWLSYSTNLRFRFIYFFIYFHPWSSNPNTPYAAALATDANVITSRSAVTGHEQFIFFFKNVDTHQRPYSVLASGNRHGQSGTATRGFRNPESALARWRTGSSHPPRGVEHANLAHARVSLHLHGFLLRSGSVWKNFRFLALYHFRFYLINIIQSWSN